jgi:thiamine transport system ATP-binding protein
MLEVEDLVVRFGARTAVDAVRLSVAPGDRVVVLGPSGCGKTTLLRAIAGLQPPDRGRVRWDGTDVTAVPPHERRFGLMFQEYALFPHRDVAGNVEFGLRMRRIAGAARRARLDAVLDLVGLRELRDRRVATLSGGEQQRVALARALAVEPRLLMLDEPLGALDRVWRERLLAEIRNLLVRTGLPSLYVTHDHGEAFTLATRLVVMRAGRIVQCGSPRELWRQPADAWTAAFLGFGDPVAGELRAGTLVTPWGDIPQATPGAGPVEVVLRPDATRLDGLGTVEGTVAQSSFTGPEVVLTVDVAGAPPLPVRVAQRDAPAPGARVRVAFDPDGVLVYPCAPD